MSKNYPISKNESFSKKYLFWKNAPIFKITHFQSFNLGFKILTQVQIVKSWLFLSFFLQYFYNVNPLLSIFIHFCLFWSIFINFQPFSSFSPSFLCFLHFCPFVSIFIQSCPFPFILSTLIHFHLFSPFSEKKLSFKDCRQRIG